MENPNNFMVEVLATEFKSGGFEFKQMRRHGKVALFLKAKRGHSHTTYETVIIQTHPAERVFGRDLPDREVMPSSETWGTQGWSDSDLERALARYNRLAAICSKPNFPLAGSSASASETPGNPDDFNRLDQLPLL